jgi:hypothetical protein
MLIIVVIDAFTVIGVIPVFLVVPLMVVVPKLDPLPLVVRLPVLLRLLAIAVMVRARAKNAIRGYLYSANIATPFRVVLTVLPIMLCAGDYR